MTTLTDSRFEQIASHHQSCAGLCETNTVVAALRASRERESGYKFALERIARFENRHGASDEAQIARAALGKEAPHA